MCHIPAPDLVMEHEVKFSETISLHPCHNYWRTRWALFTLLLHVETEKSEACQCNCPQYIHVVLRKYLKIHCQTFSVTGEPVSKWSSYVVDISVTVPFWIVLPFRGCKTFQRRYLTTTIWGNILSSLLEHGGPMWWYFQASLSELFEQWMGVAAPCRPFASELHVQVVVCTGHWAHTADFPADLWT